MLNEDRLVGYLLAQELISPETIVASDLAIHNVSRRNNNFKVLSEHGPCLMLKQGGEKGAGPGTLAHEAAAYHFLAAPGASALHRFVPRLHNYDPGENMLVLELTENAENLRSRQIEKRSFSLILARRIGEALGILHSPDLLRRAGGFDAPYEPSIFSLIQPDAKIFHEISSANLSLFKTIQAYPAFRQHLGELKDSWSDESFVHGDFKWDNCIAFAGEGSSRATRLRIVDWEFAGTGDRAWDVGSVFSDYLTTWLMSIPLVGDSTPKRWVELAAFPLEVMQPAIGAFWASYLRHAELTDSEAGPLLSKSVRFCAARLLQTAYEYLHESITITGNIYCFLQLALNMLERPEDASVHLLGLPEYRVSGQ